MTRVHGSMTPLPAETGNETAFIVLWKTLRDESKMDALRHLVLAQRQPLVVTSDGGVIRCANCAFALLFGVRCPDDLTGTNAVEAFVEPRAREVTRAHIQHDCHEYLTLAHDPLTGLPFVVAVRPRPVVWDGRQARAAFVHPLEVPALAPLRLIHMPDVTLAQMVGA